MNWESVPIGTVIRSSQYGLSLPAESNGRIPIVGMKDIQDGRVQIDPNFCVNLSEQEAESYLLSDGDILLNRTNSPDLVGKAGIYRGNDKAVFASYLVRLHLELTLVDPDYVIQILASEDGQRHIKRLATRAISQANLNPTTFKHHFQIPLPKLHEQIRIRNVLGSWDTVIQKTEQLIAALRTRREWLRCRAAKSPGRTAKLGDFLKHKPRPLPKPEHSYWALGIRSHGKGTFQRFVDDPSQVDMKEVYAVKHQDVIVNITFAWEGAIALVQQRDERCYVSHRFPTFEIDKSLAEPDFIKHIFNRTRFFQQLSIISPGGAGRNRVLNKKDFLELTISLPSLPNQKKHANALEATDGLIQNYAEQLAAFRKQKRGLMQKLLTGQWRLLEPETV